MDLKEKNILGEDIVKHWYYRSKVGAVKKLLANVEVKNILDIGAGSGFFSKSLLSTTKAEKSWCVDIFYESDSDVCIQGKQICFRKSIDFVDVDTILMMDVLEHVDDDRLFLREYLSKVPKDAVFIISVPAFQFLWSGHDVFLGHKRRYTLKQLEQLIISSGLTLLHSNYYFGAVFPIAAMVRMAERIINFTNPIAKCQLKKHSSFVNEIFATISNFELHFMKYNRFAGLTVFCMAKKS